VNRTDAKSFDALIVILHTSPVTQMIYYKRTCFNAL